MMACVTRKSVSLATTVVAAILLTACEEINQTRDQIITGAENVVCGDLKQSEIDRYYGGMMDQYQAYCGAVISRGPVAE